MGSQRWRTGLSLWIKPLYWFQKDKKYLQSSFWKKLFSTTFPNQPEGVLNFQNVDDVNQRRRREHHQVWTQGKPKVFVFSSCKVW